MKHAFNRQFGFLRVPIVFHFSSILYETDFVLTLRTIMHLIR